MNRILSVVLIVCFGFYSSAQILPNRYNEEVFAGFTETSEVLFSTSVPTPEPGGGFYEWITGYPLNVKEYDTFNENLYMDIFEPTGDTIALRPLVIICFGGGFLAGSKDHWSMRLIAQKLAKRGYVTATIDYRLGMNIFDEDLSKRAPYRGLQDGRSAIRYFKADADGANTYKIDVNNIYIGGHSSGGFIALHNAYLDKEDERPLSTYAWTQDGNAVADQLCLDCVGNNQGYTGNATAVFSLAGALGETEFVESSSDPISVMFHSTDDETVPYDSGQPFSSYLWLVVGDDLPDVYGSLAISEEMDAVGLPYQFNSYTNRGHDVHEASSSALYTDIIPKISDSFYYKILKPIDHPIFGKNNVCEDHLTESYSSLPGEAKYYDWEIEGGLFENMDIITNQVTVTWDPLAPVHKLKLTPYSEQAAKGKKIVLDIEINENGINTWLGGNGDWNQAAKWSLNHVPLACEDVILPQENTTSTINILAGNDETARSVYINKSVTLNIEENGSLEISTGGNLIVEGTLNVNDTLVIKNINAPLINHLESNGTVNVLEGGLINVSK
jgi:acetyl esterase/lipase